MRSSPLARVPLRLGAAALAFLSGIEPAFAEPSAPPPPPLASPTSLGHERYLTPIAGSSAYWHAFAGLSLGDGIRFNNPYRLSTPLGKTPESLSLTSAYYDIGLGAVRGPLDGLAHGAIVHLSIAAQGIPQEVLSLSYIALDRIGNGRTLIFGRAGVPIILQPDLSAGIEAAVGAAFMVTAGLGVQGELVGSLYYGAGTFDHSVSTIPVLSGQLGLFVDYEVLP